ncbi:hypothetical protein [Pseudomonas mediterranea]|uniref:hypothetical protein n=1 Tax=Pseudomonas mediterranea TaxID=183795 RepID=UPI0006D8D3A2|nr:hypothetical protein [Pseudomonas mediterranea]
MAGEPIIRGPWPAGINNRAPWKNVPPGAVRDSVNVDPLPGGMFGLRSGFTVQVAGTDIRGALSVGNHILFADGTQLKVFDAQTSTTTVLATIAGAGRFTGDVWNEELFFCTENENLRYRDGVLRQWGVTTVSSQPVPTVVAGGLLAGEYQCAATFVDAYGDEGGTNNPVVVTVAAGSAMRFTLPTPPAGGKVRLYVGNVQGGTLYLQFEGTGQYTCSTVVDNTARLDTVLLRAPLPADFICEHNGVIAMADGKTLWLTTPLRPHLRSAMSRFFQYPADIDCVISSDGGLFVAADKTYFISAVESDSPAQATLFPYGAVRGSMARAPDDRAVWMTQYGLAKSDGSGRATLLSAERFVPELASQGGSGILERNGNQLVVTTMQRAKGENPLSASDYYEAEIITP